jgi:hypothetical protein
MMKKSVNYLDIVRIHSREYAEIITFWVALSIRLNRFQGTIVLSVELCLVSSGLKRNYEYFHISRTV